VFERNAHLTKPFESRTLVETVRKTYQREFAHHYRPNCAECPRWMTSATKLSTPWLLLRTRHLSLTRWRANSIPRL